MKEIIYKQYNFMVYKDGYMYYYDVENKTVNFIPYKVNGEKIDNKHNQIIDIEDFINICEQCTDVNITKQIVNILKEKHNEDIDKVWDRIRYIESLKIGK